MKKGRAKKLLGICIFLMGFMIFSVLPVQAAAPRMYTIQPGKTWTRYDITGDGKKDKIIADDVYSYLPIDEKHIALLIDYSMKSYRGDLQYYLGKEELKSIDEDVSFIFGGKEIY